MPDEKLLLVAAISAATVVAVLLLVLRWLNRLAWLAVGGAVALAIALLIGGAILDIWPQWKLAEDRDRYLLLLLPMAVLAEVVAVSAGKRRWLAWAARSVVALAVVPVLLWGSVYLAEPSAVGANSILWWVGSTAALLAVWVALLPLVRSNGNAPFALGLGVVVGCASLTILLSNSISLGTQGVPLAGALLGAAIAGIGAGQTRWGEGWLGVALILYFGLLVRAFAFIDLPVGYVVPLWLAPLLAWVPESPALRHRANWARGGLRAGLVMVPVAIVVLVAGMRFVADSKNHGREEGPSVEDYANFGK
jgi:hypothetical protein